ncbi:MAG: hypothetical protein ACFFDF_01425 [Candidatus Odinarchaeota archaeon]
MKETDVKNSTEKVEFEKLPSINKKNQLYSNHLNNMIKSLLTPSFLGSIHMKKTNSNTNSIESLVENELKLKTTKALKSTLFNPVTKILIILAIVFNLIWFALMAIL